MIRRLFVLLVLFLIVFTSTALAATPDEATIVSSFKTMVGGLINRFQASYKPESTTVRYIEPDNFDNIPGRWVKYRDVPTSDYSMDVQKSDSLMSPYTGYVEVRVDCYISTDCTWTVNRKLDNFAKGH